MKFLNSFFKSANHFFVTIVILASVLRIFYLDSFPKGLHYQEATVGWRAQNLINSGQDEFGRRLPIYFSNWTEIEMPLTTYLIMPFVAISKSSIFFLRLPFAISGILLVIGTILLVQKLYPDKKNLGLLVGFVMAVSPSTIWFSRFVNPQIIAFSLIIWGLYIMNLNNKWQIPGAILLGLSIFVWAETFILIVPLAILLIRKQRKYKELLPLGFFCLLFLILFWSNKSFYDSWVENSLSLLKDTSVISDINLIRGQNLAQGLPDIINVVFFNKTYYLILVLRNFLSYFNPSYIFAKGDGVFLNGLSNFGLMLVISFPLFIIGLYNFIKNKYAHKDLILGWFVTATFSSLFIINAPDSKRFLFAVFPLSVLAGIGFFTLNRIFKWIFLGLIFFNLIFISYDGLVKENLRQQVVFHNDTLQLISFIGEKTEGNVWLTDAIDQNIGPKIGYIKQLSYKESNLSDGQVDIYRRTVKRINNIYIGHKDEFKNDPNKFDYILKSEKEEHFGCFSQRGSFGEGGQKYVLLIKCKEEANAVKY